MACELREKGKIKYPSIQERWVESPSLHRCRAQGVLSRARDVSEVLVPDRSPKLERIGEWGPGTLKGSGGKS